MKRYTLFLIALMTLTLTACNSPLDTSVGTSPDVEPTPVIEQETPVDTEESDEPTNEPTDENTHTVSVNLQESVLVREGKKTLITDYYHVGTADFAAITITADEDKHWTSIDAIVDMTSLEHTDGQSEQVMEHLKSDDFFGVEMYPTSHLVSTDITPTENGYHVTADLTIKDQTHPVDFIFTTEDNTTYTTSFAIDRTKRDITFGSNNFFDNLGDNVIGDMIQYDVTIVTE